MLKDPERVAWLTIILINERMSLESVSIASWWFLDWESRLSSPSSHGKISYSMLYVLYYGPLGLEHGRQPTMQHNYATSHVCKINLKNERRKALLVLNLESPLD